jgi:hypothetical protein
MKNKKLLILFIFLIVGVGIFLAHKRGWIPGLLKKTQDPATELVLEWYQFALRSDRFTEGFRAPVAARAYAYIGLAAYEAAHPFLPGNYHSLANRFEGLVLPVSDPALAYHLPTVLNATYNGMFQKLFLTAPFNIEAERLALVKKWMDQSQQEVDRATWQRSKEYGEQIAAAMYAWSETDSLGHMGHLHNFDREYIPPDHAGSWEPCQDFPTPSLLPYWGKTRIFLLDTSQFHATPLPPFSLDSRSIYAVNALELYTLQSPLSTENRWIGEFWSDDHPGLTFSSAGRWISITNQIVTLESPSIEKTLETYLRLGLAMSDAIVLCWREKYTFNLMRPETLIRKLYQADWRPVIHTPPFPSYPAGHAMVAAASAEVLTALYGDNFAITDYSHEHRPEFRSEPRSYRSFYEMAAENSYSRIALGVHFRFDCEEGTRLGTIAGKKIAQEVLKE